MSEGADRDLLRRYVDASALSQNEIGRRVGVAGTTVGNYMRGRDSKGAPAPISARRLAQLADTLGITAEELREAGRGDAVDALGQIDRIKGGTFTTRLEKLRDQLDALITESRGRGL